MIFIRQPPGPSQEQEEVKAAGEEKKGDQGSGSCFHGVSHILTLCGFERQAGVAAH